MRRLNAASWGVFVVVCVASIVHAGDIWIENFDDVGNWKSVWRYAPAEFRVRDGALLLVSPPEGSTAVAATTPVINLDRYRYMVVKVTNVAGEGDTAHQFRISLNRVEAGARTDRADGICSVFKPGFADPTLIVIDLRGKRTGWGGRAAINIEVQACYARTRIGVDSVRITDALTPKDKADWETTSARILGPKPLPFHGLEEMAARRGWIHAPYLVAGVAAPPSAKARPLPVQPYYEHGKRYLSERLIYRDSVTGDPVWRMTNYPHIDGKYYMNRLHWNANGSIMRWGSRRGGPGQWFMDANGANLRAWDMGIPGWGKKNKGLSFSWHEKDPESFFYMEQDAKRRIVYRVNVRTGEKTEAVAINTTKGLREFKVHPDGEHFLFVEPLGSNTSDDARTRMSVTGPKGLMHTFILEHNVQDKTQFTGSQDLSLYVVVTRPRAKRGGYVMGPDGTNRFRLVPVAGHDDWTGSGKWLVGYHENQIFATNRDGTERRTLVDLRTGGHLGCALDDRSVLSDVFHNGPWSDSLLFMDIPTCTTHRICMASSSFTGHSHKHIYHPSIHSNHPHPSLSPDGTKGLFQSDYMSTYTNVYVVVTHLPDPPRKTRIEARSLRWEPGERHRETKGYFVYRASQSGGQYQQINAKPLVDTRLTLKRNGGFYVVTAVENSGLESLPSTEVCASANWLGRVRRVIEAESCELDESLRLWLGGGTAVGMYGVGLRDGMKKGSLRIRTTVPRKGAYRLLARIRRKGMIAVGGARTGLSTADLRKPDTWRWRDVSRLTLSAGQQDLTVHLEGADFQVDQFMLTDEAGYKPTEPVVLDAQAPAAPSQLQAKVLDPFTVRLDWRKSKSIDVTHYNVYCGIRGDYTPSQARRIGSPAELAFVDWGLKPATAYHYKVVAVDRAGNESTPVAIAATTTQTPIVTVPLEAEVGELAGAAKAIETKAAQNGKAVQFPAKGDPGALTVTFDVPLDGEYVVWAHVFQHKGSANPIIVDLDDKLKMPWRVRVPGRKWGWDFVGGKGRVNVKRWSRQIGHVNRAPLPLNLKKGSHTLTLSSAQGHWIDKLVVTNDPGYEKTGYHSLTSH